MKLISKLLISSLLFFTFSSHALEEPPGSESIADGDKYLEQLAKDRAVGKFIWTRELKRAGSNL